jgi:hypothetical protein
MDMKKSWIVLLSKKEKLTPQFFLCHHELNYYHSQILRNLPWLLSFFFQIYETNATIVIPQTNNVKPTIIATSFFLLDRLFFSRYSKTSKHSKVTLRITHLAHSLDRELGADEMDEPVDLNTTTS